MPLLSYPIFSGALQSAYLLLSYSTISLASHISIILIATLTSFHSDNPTINNTGTAKDGGTDGNQRVSPGDVIMNVDGTDTSQGTSAEEVAALIRGKEGTKATLRLQRTDKENKAKAKEYDIAVIRRSFKLRGVQSKVEKVRLLI